MKPFPVLLFASSLIHLSTESFIFPTEENIRNIRRLRNNFQNKTSSTSTENSALTTSNDDILNEIEDTHLKTVLPKSFCKNNSSSCADPSYYPTKLIQRALYKQGKEFKNHFETNFPSNTDENDSPAIQARTGLVQEWKNLCDVSTTFTKPRLAQNKEGESLYIVNFDADDKAGMGRYQQLIRVTTCSGGGQCGQVASGDMVTRCQQEYTDIKLIALDRSGDKLIEDTFPFPSCCTCVYSSVFV